MRFKLTTLACLAVATAGLVAQTPGGRPPDHDAAAKNTEDLFLAQGYVVAQDRMWQLEMWRRNGEGRLSEVLGPDYVTRDKFARLIAFRGNWDEEFTKYHPEGRVIFESFARGINAAIQQALDENKIPVEFQIMGFRPAA